MPETTTRLQMPFIMPSQAQKHVTHNEALQRLDALVQMTTIQLGAEAPPPAPDPGDMHGLGAVPTGVWAGQAGKLAIWENGVWVFITPEVGWRVWDQSSDSLQVYDGVGWQMTAANLDNLNGVGIGASFDPVNRLVLASDASLFGHAGGGHQLKINKAAAIDTASVLFQSGYTGFAEMGLAGDNRFSVKVSADGSTWYEAMKFDAGAQSLTLAPGGTVRATLSDTGLALEVPLTGAAVQSGPEDATEGRLMKVGAFGLGGVGDSALYDPNVQPLVSAFFALSSLSTTNKPVARRFAGQRIMRSSSSGHDLMGACDSGFSEPRLFTRSIGNGVFGHWGEIFHNRNVLGPVSQTSGVPSGALIERGSNANGTYIRFADGLQICTNANTAITTAPAAFVGTITKIDSNKLWLGRWF